ncbi:MAG: single-stranded DNA-binding protein [Candidatus Brocadiaceae bacterium]|nr:single-stranded DNA-binding protein [Candidatus Brocadiaceae bacterium]
MTTTITGKLNKEPKFFPLDSGGAVISFSIGKKEYDRKTKTEVWANYSVGVFAKDKQLEFYTNKIKEGSIVSVSGSGIIPEAYQDTIFLKVQNPRIDYVNSDLCQAIPQQAQQQNYQQAPQQAPQSAGFDDFQDDSIPF